MVDKAKAIVGDDAEDVIQDVMEYFIKSRMNTVDQPLPLLLWYVKNRCIQHIRKKKRAVKHIYSQDFIEEQRDWDQEEYEPRPEIDLMLEGLMNLHPFARELFILTVCEGWRVVDVAKQTGIKAERLFYIQSKTIKAIDEYTKEKRRTQENAAKKKDR
jgi:RNA polymerase sigma factor (sigma-70 family)